MGKTTKTVYSKDNPIPPEKAEQVSIIFRGISRNPSKDDSEKPKEELGERNAQEEDKSDLKRNK